MHFSVSSFLPSRLKDCSLLVFIFCLSLLSATFPADATGKVRSYKASAIDTNPNLPDPDKLLNDVYKSLAANNLQAAQTKVDALIEAYPHFQLAHLIRGDILLLHTRPIASFGGYSHAQADKLKELREEAAIRIKSLRDRPDPDLIPRAVLQLREDQKQVLVVDAKKSRMYVYENHAGQLKLTNDYYVSQGKFGTNKLKEGDQKTPLGVYYITSRLSGSKLPDFYGPGALPLNYPNEWDKINGRNGSGIWLHGMPSESFSRPPLASDGCVVLTNPDFLKIASVIDIGKTPVIISEQVEFVNHTKWNVDKSLANKLIDDWRLDLESQNANRVLTNYSRNFRTLQGDNLNIWFSKQLPQLESLQNPSIKLKDITQFRYPGKEELIVSTFTQETSSKKNKTSVRKRQYWIKEAAKWRIIYETTV
ncbi:L,D-transpeptidase family protein [Undibacterium sp. SXout7W]|uniref:L,D-transpeptidase family protein n=1 Tax=Undibacterium sp. SXout7W TaxID=3413049 RepID=UPI003BF38CBC